MAESQQKFGYVLLRTLNAYDTEFFIALQRSIHNMWPLAEFATFCYWDIQLIAATLVLQIQCSLRVLEQLPSRVVLHYTGLLLIMFLKCKRQSRFWSGVYRIHLAFAGAAHTGLFSTSPTKRSDFCSATRTGLQWRNVDHHPIRYKNRFAPMQSGIVAT